MLKSGCCCSFFLSVNGDCGRHKNVFFTVPVEVIFFEPDGRMSLEGFSVVNDLLDVSKIGRDLSFRRTDAELCDLNVMILHETRGKLRGTGVCITDSFTCRLVNMPPNYPITHIRVNQHQPITL